jgi:hypothetical protein
MDLVKLMVGLPGFEPGSIAPEATSLDQASRKPPKTFGSAFFCGFLNSVGLALNLNGSRATKFGGHIWSR